MTTNVKKTTYAPATYLPASSSGNAGMELRPQSLELGGGVLRRELQLPQGHEQQGHRQKGDEEGESHLTGKVPARLREHTWVRERLGEAHGDEVERHEGAGGDREHRGGARLPLRVLDREAQRVVDAVEEEDDQEAHEHRLVPYPPVAPGGTGPDQARHQHPDAEDDREVDGHVGADVPGAVATAQVLDRHQTARHPAAERDDRHGHMDVEDLLDEALVGVVGRIEED